MATFTLQPIDVVTAPNYYSFSASNTFALVDPNATTLNFLLMINDALGTRPYFPAMNATLTLTFGRMNQFTNGRVNPIETSQSIIKPATRNVTNGSMYSVKLTTQDVQNIRSGSLQFTLIDNGTTTISNENWKVTKTLANTPGC